VRTRQERRIGWLGALGCCRQLRRFAVCRQSAKTSEAAIPFKKAAESRFLMREGAFSAAKGLNTGRFCLPIG
jgi:hypothetical protein